MRQKPGPKTKPPHPSKGRSRKTFMTSAKTGRSSLQTLGLKTILVPIDFSSASLHPIQWAKFIARQTKVSIHFVNVHDLAYPMPAALIPSVIGSKAEIRDRLHRHLQAIALSQKIRNASFQIRVVPRL